MQYIQLRTQSLNDIPVAPYGAFNLYYDSTHNTLKSVGLDTNGSIISGETSPPLVTLTISEMTSAMSGNTLVPGRHYLIKNVDEELYGGTDIILQSVSKNTFNYNGVGLFYNPKWNDPSNSTPESRYSIWDGTFCFYFNGLQGFFDHDEEVFCSSNGNSGVGYLRSNVGYNTLSIIPNSVEDELFFKNNDNIPFTVVGYNTEATANVTENVYKPNYSIGDKVIWGNKVWINLSGNTGNPVNSWPNSQLLLNEEDWRIIENNDTDYDLVCDEIFYNFNENKIIYRKNENNEVHSDSYWWNVILFFPWGNPVVSNVIIKNSYTHSLINFPNFQNNELSNITFDNNGGFNAHYWGRGTQIYNIKSDFGGHMVSLNLGDNTRIYNINLGINSTINSIYTYNNDYNNDVIYDLTLGSDAFFGDSIYLYTNSKINVINMCSNSNFDAITMYPNTIINDINVGMECNFESITMSPGSNISFVRMLKNSNFRYINCSIETSINNISIGDDSEMSHFSLGSGSYINEITLGTITSFKWVGIDGDGIYGIENINISDNCEMHNLTFGNDSYLGNVKLESHSTMDQISTNDYNHSFNINNIHVGVNGDFSYITMGSNVLIHDIELIGSGSIGGVDCGDGSILYNIQVNNGCGFGEITLNENVQLNNFNISQNSSFGGMVFTNTLENKVISKSFNNLNCEIPISGYTGNLNGSNFSSYATPLDVYNNTIKILDTNGWDGNNNSLNFWLPSGLFEGQKITFYMTSFGTNMTTTKIIIWLPTFTTSTNSNIHTNLPWYPFASVGVGSDFRIDPATITWINNKWIIDNGQFD